MNRTQRKFAGIERLMGHGPRRWHRISMASRLPGGGSGMHLDAAGGGGGAKVELVKFDHGGRTFNLNESIKIDPDHVDRDVIGYMEALRYQACQLFEKFGPNAPEWKEALGKITADMQTVIDEQDKALKDYRKQLDAKKGTDPVGGGLNPRAFQSLQLRFDPQGEATMRARSIHEGGANGYLARMSLAQFNLTCVPMSHLDIQEEHAARKIERLRKLHDVLSLAVTTLSRRDPFFNANGGWEGLPWAAEFKALALEIGQGVHSTRLGPAINETNADEGKNWVPGPILSGRLYPMVEEEIVLPGAFESIPMAAKTVDSGVLGAHTIAYRLVENLTDVGDTSGAKIKASAFVTKKFTLDAELYAAAAVLSPNWLQDNALANADWAMRDIAYAMANGEEQWLINGQATAQIDTGLTIATDDIRNNGDGLRYWYKQMKDAALLADVDLSAGITAESLVRIFGQQGNYGNRPRRSVWACNVFCLAQLMVLKTSTGRDVVLTFGQAGDRATFRTGVVAQMFDRDVITSNNLTQTMDGNGIDTGAGDRGVLMHIFTEAVKFGRRLGVSIEMSSDYRFLEYQEVLRAVARGDWGRVYDPTVHPFIGQGTGVPKLA